MSTKPSISNPPPERPQYSSVAPIAKPPIKSFGESPDAPNAAALLIVAWVGTAVAGGVFGSGIFVVGALVSLQPGMLMLGLVGGVVGFIIAGVVGAAVIPSWGVLTWAAFLDTRPQATAVCGGALTGLLSGIALGPIAIVTAVMGGVGAAIAVRIAFRKDLVPQPGPWRFSLNQMFMRVTGICVLLVVWIFILTNVFGVTF